MCSVVPLVFEQERQLSAACFNRFFLMTDCDKLFARQVINKNRKKIIKINNFTLSELCM